MTNQEIFTKGWSQLDPTFEDPEGFLKFCRRYRVLVEGELEDRLYTMGSELEGKRIRFRAKGRNIEFDLEMMTDADRGIIRIPWGGEVVGLEASFKRGLPCFLITCAETEGYKKDEKKYKNFNSFSVDVLGKSGRLRPRYLREYPKPPELDYLYDGGEKRFRNKEIMFKVLDSLRGQDAWVEHYGVGWNFDLPVAPFDDIFFSPNRIEFIQSSRVAIALDLKKFAGFRIQFMDKNGEPYPYYLIDLHDKWGYNCLHLLP